MSTTYLPGLLRDFPALLRVLPDLVIRRPLWEFAPHEVKAVIHERRRRFGVDDDEGARTDG